ncbi:MAG: hypothetical protein IKP86_01460 [Anaerolineaceae bacterium]|nr:hypothetical protein [Anaerolineaceae bacterium]
MMITAGVCAQDIEIIARPTAVPEDTITLVNPDLASVSGDSIITGKGNYTVTLWDRSKYVNQPKSVVLPNAVERFQDGMEVPKPSLDRPVTDAWDDLKQGYACEAILNRPYYFQQMKFGEEFELDITFRNVGTQTWDFNVDVMKYTGDPLEKNPNNTAIDLWKTVDPDSENINSHIVKPGQSVRVKIPMRAPTEKYHDDNKYYAAYTLVRNWGNFGWTEYLASGGDVYHSSWDTLHDGEWDRLPQKINETENYVPDYEPMASNALFCPVYFYIYVPE